jgi:hypothetical protein
MRFKGAERKRLNHPTGGKFSVAIVVGVRLGVGLAVGRNFPAFLMFESETIA